MRRLGGVAESPEKLVAARRGGHPAPPVREMLNLPYLIAGVINRFFLVYGSVINPA
jgi:hypothetical protein